MPAFLTFGKPPALPIIKIQENLLARRQGLGKRRAEIKLILYTGICNGYGGYPHNAWLA